MNRLHPAGQSCSLHILELDPLPVDLHDVESIAGSDAADDLRAAVAVRIGHRFDEIIDVKSKA